MNTSNITNYKPKDFAELLGVSVKTLQRWDREGILKANHKVDIIKYYLYETLWREFEEELPPDYSFWSIEYGTMFFKQMKRHREDILVLKLDTVHFLSALAP